jgi:ribonuclease BN (tRNA processing enzyme)
MFLDDELLSKKGWGHSSIEQGINFFNQITVKNFLISHHSPSRTDKQIDEIQKQFPSTNIKCASENEVIDF